MKFCTKCGKELLDEAVVCTGCGCPVEGAQVATTVEINSANMNQVNAGEPDQVNIGLCVVSALIPLFGIIYWALKYKETPKKAKACGITAIVAYVISIVFGVICGLVSFLLLSGMYY